MRTVKEVFELTGISVRTLHYYDEIGLVKPTKCSEAGYRLYDDKALEILQRVLFFKEFDLPLKNIKSILDNPDLDKNLILQQQKEMLELKAERLKGLITSIDGILKGEKRMDFAVFSKAEIEDLYQDMIANMSEDMKKMVAENYDGIQGFHDHYMENAGNERTQQNFQKVVEWYGDKESVLNAARDPIDSEILKSYQQRIESITEKLAGKKGKDISAFEVRELIGEYGFVLKQLYQIKDEKPIMLSIAASYQEKELAKVLDDQYGMGTAEFFGSAIEAFYN